MMKPLRRIVFIVLTLLLAVSCVETGNPVSKTTLIELADSSRYINMSLKVELPASAKGADAIIAQEVIDMAVGQMFWQTNQEAEENEAPKGVTEDEMREYFAGQFSLTDSLAKQDYDFRAAFIEDDSTNTEEEKRIILENAPAWTLEFCVVKIVDEPEYCVYLSRNYVYLGGAHGGVTGEGAVTFSKKDGHRITGIIRSDCEAKIQPLIRKGLLDYFRECGDEMSDEGLNDVLFLEGGELIPLPVSEPYPSPDGMTFVYNQYEIAPYAMGMPEFTLTWEDVSPFLSSDWERVARD